jgi:uncharacterized radical SAM superfamily Fe-S cluster-containing enzyme
MPTTAVIDKTAFRARVERREVLWEVTRSLCPECRRLIDAQVLLRGNQVIQRKHCPEHGLFEALVFNDAELYQRIARYNGPGTIPLEFATQPRHGCPYDCGLCSEHQQHTCLAVIEVTNACNLDCPLCFAGAGTRPSQGGYWLTYEQVNFMLDRLLAYEGRAEVLQFSGGEPTLHPRLLDFVALARQKGIQYVMVNTNGLRIAHDDVFLEGLAQAKPHIYLQFDGFEERTYQLLRGRPDLAEVKLRALDRLAEAGMRVVLVAVIERGVNDHEVGRIVEFGLKHPAVFGVTFHCAFHVQRYLKFDPLQRMTIPDVLRGIEAQTNRLFKLGDFVPVPCCMPDCSFVTYALLEGNTVTPLTRVLDIDSYLEYLKGRTLPGLDDEIASILARLFSATAIPGTERMASDIKQWMGEAALASDDHRTRTEERCSACRAQIPLGSHSLNDFNRHIFMVNIRDFADAWTFSMKNVMKCCIGFLVPDGRLIPFCTHNTLGYRDQVVQELMRAKERPSGLEDL